MVRADLHKDVTTWNVVMTGESYPGDEGGDCTYKGVVKRDGPLVLASL
jgi:hypothetical protein